MSAPIRVLIVDDSAFVRHTLTKYLQASPEIAVVGAVRDGQEALERIPELKPDVVTLDVLMPHKDGLAVLRQIMVECPTPVVMLSALTQAGTRTTIQALMRGAVDFVAKPDAHTNIHSVVEELVAKIKIAAGVRDSPLPEEPQEWLATKAAPQPLQRGDPLIVMGASTGGPRAIAQVLSELPSSLPAALAMVQHMPPSFTRALAQRLHESCALTVREATQGDALARGLALMAPGGYHLRFDDLSQATLDQGPRRNGLRPALDVTLESAAERRGSAVIGVVLTGMGHDGVEGARCVKAAGGVVIAEDESTATVYGMPRGVVEEGLADYVVPLPKIAARLVKLVAR